MIRKRRFCLAGLLVLVRGLGLILRRIGRVPILRQRRGGMLTRTAIRFALLTLRG